MKATSMARRKKEPTIILHPQKGVNPRIGVCTRCGKDLGIILMGARDQVITCKSCGVRNFGYTARHKCPSCKTPLRGSPTRTIEDSEHLPMGLCADCERERINQMGEVAKGGVYFRCTNCEVTGVVKADSPFAREARDGLGIQAPEPCGIEFNAFNCPYCGMKPPSDQLPS